MAIINKEKKSQDIKVSAPIKEEKKITEKKQKSQEAEQDEIKEEVQETSPIPKKIPHFGTPGFNSGSQFSKGGCCGRNSFAANKQRP